MYREFSDKKVPTVRSGFSIIELVLTLLIVVLALGAVLGILNQTQGQMSYLDTYFVRQQRSQEAMDRIMEDIMNAMAGDMHLTVERDQSGSLPTAHLVIESSMDFDLLMASKADTGNESDTEDKTDTVGETDTEGETDTVGEPETAGETDTETTADVAVKRPPGQKGTIRIDWVGVPRYNQEDLVLFRREKIIGAESSDEPAMYAPICEHLSEFDVELLDRQGESTEDDEQMRAVSVWLGMFRPGKNDPERAVVLNRSFCLNRYE